MPKGSKLRTLINEHLVTILSKSYKFYVILIISIARLIGHLHFVRMGIRNRAVKAILQLARETTDFQFQTNFFGYRYQGNTGNSIDFNVFYFGIYERQVLFLVRDILRIKDKPTVLDIGANIGHHTLFISRYVHLVYAFEPYEPVFSRLLDKVKMNGLKNVKAFQFALGDINQKLQYYRPTGGNEGTGSFIPFHEKDNVAGDFFQVINGDEKIRELEIDKIDFIKIDVEGFEKNVLVGLRETLIVNRPYIMMEFSDTTYNSFRDSLELEELLPDNYFIYKIINNQPFCIIFNLIRYKLIVFNFKTHRGNLILCPETMK